MTWMQQALTYAFLTSLHVFLIARITTGLVAGRRKDPLIGRRYAFINSMAAMPLLVCLAYIDLARRRLIHFQVVHLFHVPVPSVAIAIHLTWIFWACVLLAAWSQCSGLGSAATAYSDAEISLVTPLGAVVLILIALASWLGLHEALTLTKMLGMGLIIIGSYVILIKVKRGEGLAQWFRPLKFIASLRGLGLYLKARLKWAPFAVLMKKALEEMHPFEPYVVSCITVGFMCIYAAPWTRRQRTEIAPVLQDLRSGIRRAPQWSEFWPTVRHIARVLLKKEEPRKHTVKGGKLVAAFCLSVVILAAQQYVELNAYLRTNPAVVAAIFKLDIPLIVMWGWLFLHEGGAESDESASGKAIILQRFGGAVAMAAGAWCLG